MHRQNDFKLMYFFGILESMLNSVNFPRNCPCYKKNTSLAASVSGTLVIFILCCGFWCFPTHFLFGFEMFNSIQSSLISRAAGDKENPVKSENGAILLYIHLCVIIPPCDVIFCKCLFSNKMVTSLTKLRLAL